MKQNQMETNMHHEMMTVTPEIAERWLAERNNRNRIMSPKKVSAYAKDITSGQWQKTHQNAIAFYRDGSLADGQHRLAAIVKSARPLELMVWWGLEDKAAYGIDAHKMRATHDQIKIAGGSDWITKDVIACARMIMPGRGTHVVSPQQIVDFCDSHKDALLFSHLHLPRNRFISAPQRAAVSSAFYHEDSQKLKDWCEIMGSGIGAVPLSRTVLTLRERIMKEDHLRSGGGAVREYVIRLSMRSIQAYCAGQVLTKLYEPKERIYEIPA